MDVKQKDIMIGRQEGIGEVNSEERRGKKGKGKKCQQVKCMLSMALARKAFAHLLLEILL